MFTNILDQKDRSLASLTVGEYISLQQQRNQLSETTKNEAYKNEEKRYVYGYNGIAELFGCSKSTAARIKLSGILDAAITQVGRKIIVDVELAFELARKKKGGRN